MSGAKPDFEALFQKYKKVAVVGVSANPDRPSHWIAQYLQDNGFEVIGVNPGKPKISGLKVVASLGDIPWKLEIVNIFRSPESIPPLIEELIPKKPAVLWLQPGAQNPEAEAMARAAGLAVISGPCIYQEHKNTG